MHTLEQVIGSAKRLSTSDKIKLIKQLTSQIEQELTANPVHPGKSLRGLWKGLDISGKDIEEARKEMWGGSPGEDL